MQTTSMTEVHLALEAGRDVSAGSWLERTNIFGLLQHRAWFEALGLKHVVALAILFLPAEYQLILRGLLLLFHAVTAAFTTVSTSLRSKLSLKEVHRAPRLRSAG